MIENKYYENFETNISIKMTVYSSMIIWLETIFVRFILL